MRKSLLISVNKLSRHLTSNKIKRFHILSALAVGILVTISSIYLLKLSPYGPSNPNPNSQKYTHISGQLEYVRAKVLNVQVGQAQDYNQIIKTKILDGPDKGRVVSVGRNYILGDAGSKRLPVGSQVILLKDPSNGNQYVFFDRYRINGAITLFLLLLALIVVVGRWRGFTSAIGLSIGIAVLAVFVLPRIVAGDAAFATCIEGALIIACASIYVAHGFTRRTTIALASTIVVLLLTVGIAAAATYITGLSGNPAATVISESNASLIQYAPRPISLSGLLLGGIIIASLGVLEDITTAQAATVDEIYKANPRLGTKILYKKGLSVGREHVAALVNTLALVYVGVSLPSLVLAGLYVSGPLIITLNDETIMESVVRIIVPSIALLLAVPLSTWLAAYILPRWYRRKALQR